MSRKAVIFTHLQIDTSSPISILRAIHLHFHLFTLHRQADPHPNRLGRTNRPRRERTGIVTDDTEDVLALDADILDVFGKVGGVDDESVS
jgi:hypothetical protein